MSDCVDLEFYDWAHVMTLREFVESVKVGVFNDYDGYGYLAIGDKVLTGAALQPSQLKDIKVVWFNK